MDNSGLFGEIKFSAGSMSELRELCEDLDLDHTTALIVNGVKFLKVNEDDLQLDDRQQYEKGLANGKREFAVYILGRIAAIEMMSGIDLVSLKDACNEILKETGGKDNG